MTTDIKRNHKTGRSGNKVESRPTFLGGSGGGHGGLVAKLYPTPETLWTIAHQVPLSRGFPRQEYWSWLSLPSPGDLPHPGIELASLVSLALAGRFCTTEPPGIMDNFS